MSDKISMAHSILFWKEGNSWWAFSPDYPWVCGERSEWKNLPDTERKALLRKKILDLIKQFGVTPTTEQSWELVSNEQ